MFTVTAIKNYEQSLKHDFHGMPQYVNVCHTTIVSHYDTACRCHCMPQFHNMLLSHCIQPTTLHSPTHCTNTAHHTTHHSTSHYTPQLITLHHHSSSHYTLQLITLHSTAEGCLRGTSFHASCVAATASLSCLTYECLGFYL